MKKYNWLIVLFLGNILIKEPVFPEQDKYNFISVHTIKS